MSAIRQLLVILGLAGLCVQCSGGSSDISKLSDLNKGPVLVSVNGTDIHQGLLDKIGELNPRLKAQLDNPLARKKILDSLTEQFLLYQEAVKRGVDKSPAVEVKSAINRNVIVANELVEHELKSKLKAEYDAQKDTTFSKISAEVIAVYYNNDPKAKEPATNEMKTAALGKINAIKKRLDGGEDFATVAKAESDDKFTASKGGQLGDVSKSDKRLARQGLQAVNDTLFTLKNGQISEPIVTDKGYYLVKATSDLKQTPLEEAEQTLRFELQSKVRDELVASLKAKAKIEFAGKEHSADPKMDAAVKQIQDVAQPVATPSNGAANPAPAQPVQPATPVK